MGNIDNISAKGASFEFAGKIRRMVFINKAVQYLKEKYGGFRKALGQIDDANGEIDFDVLTDVLAAGFMVNHDETLTPDLIRNELDDMLLLDTREICTVHLIAALTGTYPEPKAKGDGDSSTPQ